MDDFEVRVKTILDVAGGTDRATTTFRMLGTLACVASIIVRRLPNEDRREATESFVSLFYDFVCRAKATRIS
jgi:hypothetical protein